MSQNDFTIANQTFPNTRADINSALQALASTSSGSSEPSTTFANQLFYNTTSNLLQIRNEDNDAFITIAELDQTNDTVEYVKSDSVRTALIEFTDGDDALAIADGGALTVSTSLDMNGTELILDADGDTSITADTDDQIDFKIGGTDRMAIDSSGVDVTGTVVSDGLTVDGTANIDGGGSGSILVDIVDSSLCPTMTFTRNGGGTITNAFLKFENTGGQSAEVNSDGGGYFLGNVGIGTSSPSQKLDVSGNVTISGSLSKGSGSFKIDHPLSEKTNTHYLVHSFVEAPQADNIYRGKVDLVGGSATINIDTTVGMTDGTFVALNTDIQCFTSNESGWTAVKGSVSGNVLTITAQANDCTDTISWMVVGERQDQHMIDTDWTDSAGKVILEPEQEGDDVIL